MIFLKYGIMLRRLRAADIELVRTMRNSKEIRQKMHDQAYITREKQVQWFEGINNAHNYFFLIFYLDHPVGLIQAKNVDFARQVCEGGIYLWSERAIGNGVAIKASVSMADVLFSALQIESLNAKVRPDNTWAFRHNLSMGYEAITEEHLVMRRERFLSLAPRFRWACSAGRDMAPASIEDAFFQPEDLNSALYTALPDSVKNIFMERIRACAQ